MHQNLFGPVKGGGEGYEGGPVACKGLLGGRKDFGEGKGEAKKGVEWQRCPICKKWKKNLPQHEKDTPRRLGPKEQLDENIRSEVEMLVQEEQQAAPTRRPSTFRHSSRFCPF